MTGIYEIVVIVVVAVIQRGNNGDFIDAGHVLGDSPDLADTVVTHRFSIEDAVEAFRVAADRKSGSIKVHINP